MSMEVAGLRREVRLMRATLVALMVLCCGVAWQAPKRRSAQVQLLEIVNDKGKVVGAFEAKGDSTLFTIGAAKGPQIVLAVNAGEATVEVLDGKGGELVLSPSQLGVRTKAANAVLKASEISLSGGGQTLLATSGSVGVTSATKGAAVVTPQSIGITRNKVTASLNVDEEKAFVLTKQGDGAMWVSDPE